MGEPITSVLTRVALQPSAEERDNGRLPIDSFFQRWHLIYGLLGYGWGRKKQAA